MGFEPVKCPPGCIYSMAVPHSPGKGACGHCGYILITGQSRGCDPGPGCRHYRRGHRLGDEAIVVHKGGARFTWDVETGRRMYLKGKTDREIADALGTKRDTVGHIRRKYWQKEAKGNG